MNKRIRILMLALAGLAPASTAYAESAKHALEGVWSFTVTPDPVGLQPYSNLRSFSRDGVAIMVDGSDGALGTSSSAVGVWEHTVGREFSIVMYAVLTRNGIQSGRQKLEAVVTLDPYGHTLSGVGRTTTYDMTGKLQFSGTAKITGERLQLLDE